MFLRRFVRPNNTDVVTQGLSGTFTNNKITPSRIEGIINKNVFRVTGLLL